MEICPRASTLKPKGRHTNHTIPLTLATETDGTKVKNPPKLK